MNVKFDALPKMTQFLDVGFILSRALLLIKHNQVHRISDDLYLVKSRNVNSVTTPSKCNMVRKTGNRWVCECQRFLENQMCEHSLASLMSESHAKERENNG